MGKSLCCQHCQLVAGSDREGNMVRENTLEIGREYALCFFLMLNTLQASAQVMDILRLHISAAFNIFKLVF